MTTVADEDVLTAAELDLTVEEIADEVEVEAPNAVQATPAAEPDGQPFLRIEKGAPNDLELAALVCVFSAAGQDAPPAPTGPADAWGRPTLMHRGSSPFSPYAFPQLSHLR
ncbi:acyl-CoA carboxylase subunit epsilon [Nocardia puris]|uniref:Acyl-CoA carboxylase epsilon subunit-like protein n=1 Tax=Nocardia puris TaxID=208602 RepID=A0A366D6B3_9NOCA|nr:acyl-CoA carboxylase subunit epsilon [Nocardia puris]MBF6212336.1 acyl-CoA carboxylase subunit epsilon [Nocardia puris]MBF6366583.1 acyl-CoA carboxylase subunit epsilon [Nocardia puris]MBF6460925.1 acyl-CoA carboxylase subunit epsilon [Nocardia puris]RBO85570.1 acyl-CoA carboxylase epsilon subunit-like protein [Nocardia puris]